MSRKTGGNGSGGFTISITDMEGWVRVFPAQQDDLRRDVPLLLSKSLMEWFRQKPRYHMRCVVPISENGTTVELHAWYDVDPPRADS